MFFKLYVLDIYGKPLKIVCVGGAERLGRFQYGILDNRDDNNLLGNSNYAISKTPLTNMYQKYLD
jgi:hypothetical protein